VILVGVDPGKITGISIWRSPPSETTLATAEVKATDTVPTLRRMLKGDRPNLVGVERYKQNGRKTHQPEAYYVTGAVRSFCDDNVVRCVYQSPSSAQRIGTPRRLRELGFYIQTKDGHANAATGHVLLLMAQYHPETYADLIGL
jgi:hypothetical protein